jgi:hypothetical protein
VSFDVGNWVLTLGADVGAEFEPTDTRPSTKATVARARIAAVRRKIRRARPMARTGLGAMRTGLVVMAFSFVLKPGPEGVRWGLYGV